MSTALRSTSTTCIAANESPDAIPVDQVEVVAGGTIPALMLPPGEFVLEARDVTDRVLLSARIEQR